jgi:hypothetical protein
VAPAPQVFNSPPFPDAAQNPAFNPVQMYHLGLWFNSPKDAAAVGCPGAITPFNGEHNAGVQARAHAISLTRPVRCARSTDHRRSPEGQFRCPLHGSSPYKPKNPVGMILGVIRAADLR